MYICFVFDTLLKCLWHPGGDSEPEKETDLLHLSSGLGRKTQKSMVWCVEGPLRVSCKSAHKISFLVRNQHQSAINIKICIRNQAYTLHYRLEVIAVDSVASRCTQTSKIEKS